MRSIAQVPDRLVKLPGRPAWQRGLVRYRGDSVLVADLGLLLGIKAGCEAPRYLLIIGDGRCAFECDSIEDAVPVVSRDVHWGRRTEGRAWLAGLLADRMCALLDADAIAGKIRHG
jgi:purine-binding chemotaxis protein CheW